MKIQSFLYALLICLTLGACCTLKYCDMEYEPAIVIQLQDFTSADIKNTTVYIYDKNNITVQDSFNIPFYSDVIFLNKSLIDGFVLKNQEFELEDFSYKLQVGVKTTGIISEITYEKFVHQVDCNGCLLGDGSATVKDFKDFSFLYEGQTYHREDTLRIKK